MNEMNQLPLAIATVPMQRFEKLYPLEKALQRGTLFQALDLPFCPLEGGERHVCECARRFGSRELCHG